MKNIIAITLLLTFFSAYSQQNITWKNKVDESILNFVEQGGKVEFIIVFKDKANTNSIKKYLTKEEKGKFVYEQLTTVADKSQRQTISILKSSNVEFKRHFIVNAIIAKAKIEVIEKIALLPEVKEIQGNPVTKFHEPVRIQNDNFQNRDTEWGITNINADDVWALGYTGQNVVVAGQDTGYDWNHPAIKEQYNGWDGTTANHNFNWHDAIHTNTHGANDCGTNSTEPCDDHNHGTHTMGTMIGYDGGTNQIGVAPGAKWIGCRNMDRGYGTPDTYIECFEWFLAPTDLNDENPDTDKAPHVINNSWGCPPSEGCNSNNFSLIEDAITNLRNAGVVVVASAGNSGQNCESVDDPPAMFEGSFSVGAINDQDTIASFSSRGPVTVDGSNLIKPNISAPGVNVRSCIKNGGYAAYQGTSMAGPHVAGTVALMISANPALSGQVEDIEDILESTAVFLETTQSCGGVSSGSIPNNTYGYGKVDALAAVNAAINWLPVELSEFYGIYDKGKVKLFWKTQSENNNDYFEVERKESIFSWKSIERLKGNGNSMEDSSYSFIDFNPKNGYNYYRIKQVDIDGNYEYSKIIAVKADGEHINSIFPNPTSKIITINLNNQKSVIETFIKVYDATGKVMTTTEVFGTNNITLDVSSFLQGIYYLEVIDISSYIPVFHTRFIKY